MTLIQEDALYDFLEIVNEAFDIDDIVAHIKKIDSARPNRLAVEVEAFINLRKLAFNIGPGRWLSRRAFFGPLSFVISPTRLEILNGILIPGHRCVPFANGNLLPHEYNFFWEAKAIPFTSSEGPPEEFYPYYNIFGEEYAPQYLARDNSENEEAFFSDPYEDPPEVSIKTLDMRNIYRETSFVPGDRFFVKIMNWKTGEFQLQKAGKDKWTQEDLDDWFKAAEEGFEKSFSNLGPGSCTEEQLAYAYWYGSSRMRELPAYSLEEYLYEKSNRVEIAPYGIETRYWYAGREIPDKSELDNENIRPDATPLEILFLGLNIPISEFVVQAYIRDSLFREGGDVDLIKERLLPLSIGIEHRDSKFLSDYVETVLNNFRKFYSQFIDRRTGPLRSRAVELHTAVIDLAARLKKGDLDISWLPRHTFIILSQIQMHCAGVLEDLGSGDSSPSEELEALDGSLDSMVETYEDIKELIDEAMNNFRRNNFALIRPGADTGTVMERLIQVSIGGIDVWRRLIVPENYSLVDLHMIIQTVFGWHNTKTFRFYSGKPLTSGETGSDEKSSSEQSSSEEAALEEASLEQASLEARDQEQENRNFFFSYLKIVKEDPKDDSGFELDTPLKDIFETSSSALMYEYGAQWNVQIMILSRHESSGPKPVRCVAGAGTAPPEFISGPLKYKRVLSALEGGNDLERSGARQELGKNFNPGDFNLDLCNRSLKKIFLSTEHKDV